MELYDSSKDGMLDAEELESAPGLKYVAERIDSDQDGMLSTGEIESMIDAWNENEVGLGTAQCAVKLGRRPLGKADIRLEPAPFLVGNIETAIGRTDQFGNAQLTVPKDKRPIPDCPPGVQVGVYHVVISKEQGDKETVPTKYNTETTLGQEVSYSDPIVSSIKVFELRK